MRNAKQTSDYKYNKTYRQTEKGKKVRYRERKKYYKQVPGDPTVVGKWWNPEEDFLIMKKSLPDVQLAKMLGRSISAISSHRCRLKKLII